LPSFFLLLFIFSSFFSFVCPFLRFFPGDGHSRRRSGKLDVCVWRVRRAAVRSGVSHRSTHDTTRPVDSNGAGRLESESQHTNNLINTIETARELVSARQWFANTHCVTPSVNHVGSVPPPHLMSTPNDLSSRPVGHHTQITPCIVLMHSRRLSARV
jgi:hypothetical protein